MKVLLGFILALLFIFLLGAATELQRHEVQVSGRIASSTVTYQSTFSGITDDGTCYLAVTNAKTGRTEIFKITESLQEHFNNTAFQRTREGRTVAIPLQSVPVR
jgi:hypothetical protein